MQRNADIGLFTRPSRLDSVLKAVGYKAVGSIVWGDAHLDTISNHDFDPVFFHTSGKDPPDGNVVFTLNFHGPASQDPGDGALQLNQIISTQNSPFKTWFIETLTASCSSSVHLKNQVRPPDRNMSGPSKYC